MHPKCYLIKTSEALKPLHLSRFNSKLFSLFELSFLDFLCFLGKRVGFRLGGELLTAKTHSLRPFGKRVGKTHSLTENPLIRTHSLIPLVWSVCACAMQLFYKFDSLHASNDYHGTATLLRMSLHGTCTTQSMHESMCKA